MGKLKDWFVGVFGTDTTPGGCICPGPGIVKDPIHDTPAVPARVSPIVWKRHNDKTGKARYTASPREEGMELSTPISVSFVWTADKKGWCAWKGEDFLMVSKTARGAMLGAEGWAVQLIQKPVDIITVLQDVKTATDVTSSAPPAQAEAVETKTP